MFPGLAGEAHDETVRRVLRLFHLYPYPVDKLLALTYTDVLPDLVPHAIVTAEPGHRLVDEALPLSGRLLLPDAVHLYRSVLDPTLVYVACPNFLFLP